MPEADRVALPVAEEYALEAREPAGYRRSDADLAREICERLGDDVGLDASGMDLRVRHGEVTLRGRVRNCTDMQRAESHACAVAGVSCVRNELLATDGKAASTVLSSTGAAAKMGKPTYEG